MGISSSKTTQKVDQKTTGTEQTSGTTQPITPEWLSSLAQDYVGRIGDFGDMDPNSFVAGSSPLQQMAWQNAPQALSGWQGQAATAAQHLNNIASGAPKGTGGGMQAPQQGFGYNAPQLGNPATMGGASYQAPNIASPSLVSGQGYSAPQLGAAGGYAAARAGSPIGAGVANYGANGATRSMIENVPGAVASDATAGNIAGNMAQFQNPYTSQVLDATMADFDNSAGMTRAAQSAAGARAGAFGGSRFALREAQTEGELARARGALGAGIRSQGFDTAAALAGQQAGMDQNNSQFNAGNQTNTAIQNAGLATNRAISQGSNDTATNLANQNAANRAFEFNADAANRSYLFNADSANRFALDEAGRTDAASQFGLGQQQQRDLAQAGLNENAGQFGATQNLQAQLANQNVNQQTSLAQAGLNENAARFGAESGFNAAGQNMAAQNQFAMAQGGFDQSAGQFNNDLAARMSMFGQGLQGEQQSRALQAAMGLQSGALGYADSTRQDLGTMAGLGDQQRGIEQAYNLAPLAQLQAMGQLSGMTPYDILVGRQVDGTSNMTGTQNGTTTTTQSPSLFNQLLTAGQFAASVFSDRALKRDIKRTGTMSNGLGLYRFRYAWDEPDRPLRTGVIADEVADIAPHALGPVVSGYRTVDYGKLGLAHLVEA